MKSFVVLMVGLTVAGAAAAFSGFALAAPTAIQSLVYSTPEPGTGEMLLAGVALMLFVTFRKKPKVF